MNQARPNPLIRILPSLTDLAFVMPIVFLFARMNGTRTLLADGDTGWHLRTGEWILANGRVPDRDLFSFTKPDQPWFAWEWGWDVAFAWLHAQAGLAAVVLGSLLLLSFTFALLFRLVRRKSNNVLVAIGATLLAMAGSSIHWLARPHLVTLLMIVVFCGILERVNETRAEGSLRNLRLLALLPLLTVLWTNLHGGFVAGMALIACYAVGELATALLDPTRDRARALAAARRYALAGAACFAASFINPYFYHLHVHIARYLANPALFRMIGEFQPLGFDHPAALYFECGLLLAAAAGCWNLYHRRFTEVLLLAGWGHMAVHSVRNYPIFSVVAAPIVALAICEWANALTTARVPDWARSAVHRFQRMAGEMGQTDSIARLHLFSAAAAVAAAVLLFDPAASFKFQARFDPAKFPVRAAEQLRGAEAHTRVFTKDQWADYLIYALYPKLRIFIDGRSDFFGFDFIDKNMVKPLGVKYDWESTLERFAINTVLLPVDEPLAGALKWCPRWRVTYDDGVAIMFRATGSLQVSAAADSGKARDRAITKPQPLQYCDRAITQPQTHTTGAIHYDDFHAQPLERRAGAGLDRVQLAYGVRRAGFRRAVHQCGRQHQHDLDQDQQHSEQRREIGGARHRKGECCGLRSQPLEGRAGAGPDRVQSAHGIRRARLGGAVHQCGWQHQHHLDEDQQHSEQRREGLSAGRRRGMPPGVPLAAFGPPQPAAANPLVNSRGWS